MKPTTEPRTTAANRRAQAEAAHRARVAGPPPNPVPLTLEAAQRLLHEFEIHQIELEMQNEELLQTEHELELSREHYFDLYDLAPVGYCTISNDGQIRQANLTLSTQLGVARGALVQQPLTRFILAADQDKYYLLRKQMLATSPGEAKPTAGSPSVDLRLQRDDGTPLWVNLTGTVATGPAGETEQRWVVADITARKQAELQISRQLTELKAWQEVMMDREDRIQELKREVNAALRSAGTTPKYPG